MTFKDFAAAVSRRFLFAFLASVVLLAPGILNALNSEVPDYALSYSLALAAAFASIAAGFKAIQELVPSAALSVWLRLGQPIGAWVDAFVQAFLGALIVALSGYFTAADFSTWHSALIGILAGALTAAFRALEGLLTPGESPAPAVGVQRS